MDEGRAVPVATPAQGTVWCLMVGSSIKVSPIACKPGTWQHLPAFEVGTRVSPGIVAPVVRLALMQRERQCICLLSLLLLLLQSAVFLLRQRPQTRVAFSSEPRLDDTQRSAYGARERGESSAMLEARALIEGQRNSSGKKDCGQTSGEFPRNRILIVHEQHLQSMGCDVRLLRLVKPVLSAR